MFVRKILSDIPGWEIHYLLIISISVVPFVSYSSLKQSDVLGLHKKQYILQSDI